MAQVIQLPVYRIMHRVLPDEELLRGLGKLYLGKPLVVHDSSNSFFVGYYQTSDRTHFSMLACRQVEVAGRPSEHFIAIEPGECGRFHEAFPGRFVRLATALTVKINF